MKNHPPRKKPEETSPPAAGTAPAGTETSAPTPAPEGTAATRGEVDQLKNSLLHLRADFDNFRKRTLRDREEDRLRANEGLLRDLLPVLDHFELGLKAAREQKAPREMLDGLTLVCEQWRTVFKKHGVTSIPTTGQPFDPHRHEAVNRMPSDQHPADTIAAELRTGYMLGHKLLRPAQVVVSSGPAAAASAAPPGSKTTGTET